MSQNVICSQKLFLTADKEAVVAEGDDRAAFLYATPGDEIPAEMAQKFGLVDGALPDFDADAAIAEEASRIAAEMEAAEKAAADLNAAHEAARIEAEKAAAAEKVAADKAAAEAAAKAKAEAEAAAKAAEEAAAAGDGAEPAEGES